MNILLVAALSLSAICLASVAWFWESVIYSCRNNAVGVYRPDLGKVAYRIYRIL